MVEIVEIVKMVKMVALRNMLTCFAGERVWNRASGFEIHIGM